jgi:ferrochelatase
MKGVLLVNMGGATSLKEMKSFQTAMFRDQRILPFRKPVRFLLSFIISNVRYKKSWKKYELIGGTPIIDATLKSVIALQTKLNHSYKVKMAFSYTFPTIEESLYSFEDEGIHDIVVIPLYPQSSFSTTESIMDEVRKMQHKESAFDIRFVKRFYQHEGFVGFWAKLILGHMEQYNLSTPFLLFSAHAIPQYLVDNGDSYPREIEESAALIANKLGLDFEVAYQSGMRRAKWIGPDVKVSLKILAKAGTREIVIIPISFVNENLETLYDIDKVIIPFAGIDLGIAHVSRVTLPEADETFIQLLADLVRK